MSICFECCSAQALSPPDTVLSQNRRFPDSYLKPQISRRTAILTALERSISASRKVYGCTTVNRSLRGARCGALCPKLQKPFSEEVSSAEDHYAQ
eukprot:IDg17032t1